MSGGGQRRAVCLGDAVMRSDGPSRVSIHLISDTARAMFGSTPGLERIGPSVYEGSREVVAGIMARARRIAEDPRSTEDARCTARAIARHCEHTLRKEASRGAI